MQGTAVPPATIPINRAAILAGITLTTAYELFDTLEVDGQIHVRTCDVRCGANVRLDLPLADAEALAELLTHIAPQHLAAVTAYTRLRVSQVRGEVGHDTEVAA